MILQDSINNILIDLNSYQGIQIACSRVLNGKSINYNIQIIMVNTQYLYHIESDEYLAVNDYQMNTFEKAKNKFQWILNKYSLTTTSIIYFKNTQTNELLAKYYKDYLLSYTFETKRISRKEMLISYTTITHPIIYKDFVENFEEILELVKCSCGKFDIELVMKQEHPMKMVRRLKLMNIDID